MIDLREIRIEFEVNLIEDVLIKSETLTEQDSAKSLFEQTEEYCQQQIKENEIIIAEKTREFECDLKLQMNNSLSKLESDFLSKTEEFFSLLESSRLDEEETITRRAKSFMHSLFNAMFDAVPDDEKINAVFRQLSRSADKHEAATLFIHPDTLNRIPELTLAVSHWDISPTENQPQDELMLRTAKGEFSLSWRGYQHYILSRLN